jgi:hypothetical protein
VIHLGEVQVNPGQRVDQPGAHGGDVAVQVQRIDQLAVQRKELTELRE